MFTGRDALVVVSFTDVSAQTRLQRRGDGAKTATVFTRYASMYAARGNIISCVKYARHGMGQSAAVLVSCNRNAMYHTM